MLYIALIAWWTVKGANIYSLRGLAVLENSLEFYFFGITIKSSFDDTIIIG